MSATAAPAATYFFDYSVGTLSGNGQFYDYDTRVYGTGDVSVTGFIETDGTLGTIDQNNIVSWGFDIEGPEDSQSISSTPVFGDATYTYGSFEATSESLTALGWYDFYELARVYNSSGRQEEYDVARVLGYGTSTRGWDVSYVYGWDRDCSKHHCWNHVTYGDYGITHQKHYGDTLFVGTRALDPDLTTTSQLAPVPVPASFPLLLAGIGGLAFLRRRRKA